MYTSPMDQNDNFEQNLNRTKSFSKKWNFNDNFEQNHGVGKCFFEKGKFSVWICLQWTGIMIILNKILHPTTLLGKSKISSVDSLYWTKIKMCAKSWIGQLFLEKVCPWWPKWSSCAKSCIRWNLFEKLNILPFVWICGSTAKWTKMIILCRIMNLAKRLGKSILIFCVDMLQ